MASEREAIVWRSQFRQDVFVAHALHFKRDGTFVDIGAGHPEQISNTVVLEREFNWRGLCCDIANFDELRAHRPTAIVLKDALVPTTRDWDDHFLSVERILEHEKRAAHPWSWHKMKALTGWIDYLSLDLEPPDLTMEVLFRLPMRDRFRICTIEHDAYREGGELRAMLLRSYMQWLGYEQVACVGDATYGPVEDWFVHPRGEVDVKAGLRACGLLENA